MTSKCIKQKIFHLLSIHGIGLFTFSEILLSALIVSVPWVLGVFIDSIVLHSNTTIFIFFLLITVALSVELVSFISKYFLTKLSNKLEIQLQNALLERFCLLPPSDIDKYKSGEVGMKFFRDIPYVLMFLQNFYPQILSTFFSVIFALIVTFYSNWIVGIVFLLSLPIQIFIVFSYKPKFSKYNHLYRKMVDKLFNKIFEFFHIFSFLKSQAVEKNYKKSSQLKFKHVAIFSMKKNQFDILFNFIIKLLTFIGKYSVLGTAGYLAWKDLIPVGQVVFYQGVFLSVLNSFSDFFRLLPMWENIKEGIISIDELLEAHNIEDDSNKKDSIVLSGTIEFRDVSYRYKNTDRDILNHFSGFIPAGSLVAVSGKNGVGKTTLLKLTTAYMEPSSGEILFDGQPISQLNKASIRSQVGVVFQEFLLIVETMYQNIILHNTEYSKDSINEVISRSCLDTVISRFPEGLDHKIGFDGGNLSGGERQKLAIARALIRNPKILVLDEVTNHLDIDSKARIKELLLSLKGKTTILLVSHDPDIISMCDTVISLDDLV